MPGKKLFPILTFVLVTVFMLVNFFPAQAQASIVSAHLIAAAQNGDLANAQRAIASGADVNAKDSSNETALMWASRHGHIDIVQLLLDNKVDINAKGWNIQTALMGASQHGQKDVVQLLIDNKADINAKDTWGFTALQWAKKHGQEDITQLLIDNKADISEPFRPTRADWVIKEELLELVRNGDLAGVQSALKGRMYLIDQDIFYGRTALAVASEEGHIDIVQLLLEKGADKTRTALWEASEKGHTEIVRLLLENGDIDLSGRIYSALWEATAGGHPETVQLLLDNGADANSGDEWGQTALFLASYRGDTKIVWLLLKNGADVNVIVGRKNETALTVAFWEGHIDIVLLLLMHHGYGWHFVVIIFTIIALIIGIIIRRQSVTPPG